MYPLSALKWHLKLGIILRYGVEKKIVSVRSERLHYGQFFGYFTVNKQTRIIFSFFYTFY